MQSVLPGARACTLQSARSKIACFQNNHNKLEFTISARSAPGSPSGGKRSAVAGVNDMISGMSDRDRVVRRQPVTANAVTERAAPAAAERLPLPLRGPPPS